jgi:hypothetical protein
VVSLRPLGPGPGAPGPGAVPDLPAEAGEPPAALLGDRQLPLVSREVGEQPAVGEPPAVTSTAGPAASPTSGAPAATTAVRIQRWIPPDGDLSLTPSAGRSTGRVPDEPAGSGPWPARRQPAGPTRSTQRAATSSGPPTATPLVRPTPPAPSARAAEAARWTPSPGAGSRRSLETDPATAALRAGVASLDPDGAVVFTPPSAPAGPPPVQRADSGTPPVQRADSGTPPVQRAGSGMAPPVEAGPPDAGAPGPPPVEAAAAPAAPPAPGTAAAPDLDDLARRLYDRIRARLRAELRLDLERAGMLTRLGR